MNNHISKPETDKLNFVLCGYKNRMVYHDFDDKTNKLSAGQPMTTESLKSIFKFVNNDNEESDYGFKGLIPSYVLSFKTDEKRIIWRTPPRIKTLLFKENLPIETAEYPIPELLWKLTKNGLSIYALKTPFDETPSMKSKVYQAPFFNVSSGGSVCMGNAKFSTVNNYYEDIMVAVENAFFNSIFTHSSTNELLKGNYIELMDLMKRSRDFNYKLLIDTKKTIKNIL
jgi:PRTRC genetic system protein B